MKLIKRIGRFIKTWTKEDWFGIIVMCILVLLMFLLRFINPFQAVHGQNNSVYISPPTEFELRGYEFCFDPIICIRDVGEVLEIPNEKIREMVRIARCESKYNPSIKNPISTATGVFQILIGTWESNNCPGDRTNFKDNIWCAWKIYEQRGSQPWISSRGCWNE